MSKKTLAKTLILRYNPNSEINFNFTQNIILKTNTMKKLAPDYYFFILIGLAFTLTTCDKDKNNEEPADPNKGTVQDVQGHSYPTVKIGDQW